MHLTDQFLRVPPTVNGEHLIHEAQRICGIYKDSPTLRVWTDETTMSLVLSHMTILEDLQDAIVRDQTEGSAECCGADCVPGDGRSQERPGQWLCPVHIH